jgi:radical SAM superfamily enzyme YgiQ (UPF0313 family)
MLTLFFGILDLIAKIAGDPNSPAFQKSIFKVVDISPFLVPTILSVVVIFLAIPATSSDIAYSILVFSASFLLCVLLYFAELHLVRDRFEKYLTAIESIEREGTESRQVRLSTGGKEDSKKTLLLINPVNQSMPGFSDSSSQHSKYQPLSLAIIAGLTPDSFCIKLVDETTEVFEYQDADLVAITGLTCSAYRAYEIASQYRRNGIPVVMGGIHASMMSDEASQYVDSVVSGEAEASWKDVMTDFLDGTLKKRYHGEPADLQNMVKPNRGIFTKQYPWVSVQTSRGCPMDCDFCSVTAFNGRKYRVRPVDEVLDELEGIPNRDIFFVDDNLIGYSKNSKERAKTLFKGMIERNLHKRWMCQAAVNFGADEELLSLAEDSGCYAVLIGFESDDPEELIDMNKKFNLQFEYGEVLKNLNRHRILVYGTFVYGTERETRRSMWRKTKFICRNRIDVVQATAMTPLPGTRLFKKAQEEGRLVHREFPKDWERYNMLEYTYQLSGLNEQEFNKNMKKCMKRIFSKWNMAKKLVKTVGHTKRPVEGIGAYVVNSRFGDLWTKGFLAIENRFTGRS